MESRRRWEEDTKAKNALADHLRVARTTVELPDDLPSLIVESEAMYTLTDCLPMVLAEFTPEDREAITQCDLLGLASTSTTSLDELVYPLWVMGFLICGNHKKKRRLPEHLLHFIVPH